MYHNNKILYNKLDRKAGAIVTKVQNRIDKHGAYENAGQDELREYCEEVHSHWNELTYPERYQLTQMLSVRINNLRY